MSKISRRQIANKKEYKNTRKKSIESKEFMSTKFAKNLLKMEELRKESTDALNDEEEEEGGSSSSNSRTEDSGSDDNSEKSGEKLRNQSDDLSDKEDDVDGVVDDEGTLKKKDKKTLTKTKSERNEYLDACLTLSKSSRSVTNKERVIDHSDSGYTHITTDELAVHTAKFRRDSINSLCAIEDARSLCSTAEGTEDVSKWMKLREDIIWFINYVEQFENFNRTVAIIIFYIIGVVFYTSYEEWNIADTVYFITISITTVGFGDLVPTNDASKLFTMFYNLLGLLVIFSYLNQFADNMLQYAERQTEKLALKRRQNKKNMTTDDDEAKQENAVDGVPYAKYRRKLLLYIALVIIVIFVGSVFYMYNEEWTFVNALYFSFIATMTIGYGDPTLHQQSSRVFSIFYVLFSVVIIAMALGNIGAIKLTIRQEKKKFDMLHRELDLKSIIAMDDDGDGVDRIEFLTAMLIQMNGLSKEDDIDPWLKRFDELDKDGSGRLDEKDLQLFKIEDDIRKQCRREYRQKLEEKQHVSGMMRNMLRAGSMQSMRHLLSFDTNDDNEVDRGDDNSSVITEDNEDSYGVENKEHEESCYDDLKTEDRQVEMTTIRVDEDASQV